MKLSEKAQTSIQKVITKFQQGDISPISYVARLSLDPSAPAHKWSFTNRVLAFIQADELDCRAFGQWKDVGRRIKKGSNAVYIVRPLTVKKKVSENEDEKETLVCIGFSTIPVFKASDTEGENLVSTYRPIVFPPLIDLAYKFNIDVEFVPVAADRYGDCTPDGKKIRLGTHDPSVFFHELTHAIQAKLEGKLKGEQDEKQEVVAEFTSAVLMDIYDLRDNSGNAWRYISHYSKDPLVAITKAMGTIEKVLQVLLE